MASSSETPLTYHVFMSFRGNDVRKNFASHLYVALDQRGIYTFMENEELRKGECIYPALMKAINESRIAVVIFSENYAESHWCLEELVKIIERNKRNDLMVLPVFYKVEPREVRGLRKSYGYALAKHECKFGKDPEKLKKWKEALEHAGSLSGWELNNDGNEAELIQNIVKEISIKLNRMPLHVTEHPVGLECRVEQLKSILSMESKDDIRMVGLWGPGGIGKTTMAKAIYNTIFEKFVGSSFIARVREKADDLVPLQKQLLSEILLDKALMIFSVDGGIALIKERLCRKKVLIVLDDVDDLKQLKLLAGACDWFGKGSRIIVTTRDKHLLTSHGINNIHEIKPLNDKEAHELFCLHCFRKSQSIKISEDIIQSALHYANGLPLALEVLGSFLHGRNEIEWKSTLTKLANSPEQTINRVLKMTFDALEHNEKEIFLDIACFFKGCEAEYVKKVLDSCGFQTTIGVLVLIERALISQEKDALQMHDLIQLMGRDIVNQECLDDPSKRSRLWLYDDIQNVLSGDMGTNSIKAIRLVLPSLEEITINPDAITNMKRLRLLILLNVHVSLQAPICLPSELRWLEWPKYSAPTLKFSSDRNKLVGLNVSNSHIREVGFLTKQLKNLKFLNCSNCESLVNIPDLSGIPNLTILNLSGCGNLVEVHQSVGFLDKLEILSLKGCSKLTRFLDVLKTKSLIQLSLSGCSGLERFPEIPEQMDRWLALNLEGSAIKEVPASIENGTSLEHINLASCRNLTTLPSSVYNLNRLKGLYLRYCCNLIQFPKKMDDSTDPRGSMGFEALEYLNLSYCNLSEVEFLDNLSCFTALKTLGLSGNKISSLPPSIKERDHLKHLWVYYCDRLCEIPELPSGICLVAATECNSLCGAAKLPTRPDICISATFYSSCPPLLNVSNVFPLEGITDQTGEVEIRVSGDEMPSWMVPVDGGYVSFYIYSSRLSPSECIGLALFAVYFCEEFEARMGSFDVRVFNTRRKDISWGALGEARFPSNLDTAWFRFMPSSKVFPDGVDEVDREYCVEVMPSNGVILRKWGWGIIWKDGRDDSNVVVQHEQLTESDPRLVDDRLEHNDSEGDEKTENGGEDCDFKWAQLLWKGCLAAVVVGLTAASLRKRIATSSLRKRLRQ